MWFLYLRIAFFLVTTRTLAHQQYQRVKRSTKLKVERVMGNDVTLWKKDQVGVSVYITTAKTGCFL